MTHRPKLLASLAALIALVALACGSTVPIQEQEAAEAAAEQGLTDGGLTTAGGTTGTDFGTGDGSVSSTGGGSGTVTGSGTTAGGSGGSETVASGRVTAGENGPGVTSDEIKIGIGYAEDTGEANQALGAAGASQAGWERAHNAMIDYINANGGIGGRKVVPVFHRLQTVTSEPIDQQDQEACAHWTEDDPVFISNGAWRTENGIACLEKAGTVVMTSNGLRYKSGSFFEKYPHYVEFDGIDNDDHSTLYADSMAKLKFFSNDAKLGILSFDDPEYAGPVQNTLIPRLDQLGVEVTDVAFVKRADNTNESGEMVSQINNAVVRFKGEGITHVMFLDQGANLAFFFMQGAERQQYRPRYGLTTGSGGTTMADLLRSGGDEDARAQLHGAVAVGWFPTIDVRSDDLPAWATPASQEECYKIMRKGGVNMDSANARAQALSVCDSHWTMKATLEAAGKVLNQDTFIRGLDAIDATKLDPTSGMELAFSATRHDGNAQAAFLRFFDKCVCFRYTSDRFQVPD
ncbi:MAG: hypothetical protein ACRDKT_05735 [Actinomycetota bacterium]